MAPAGESRVNLGRTFNRFYTKQIGLLREGLLNTRFSLTQARVLYEIFHEPGVTSKKLAERLNLEAGYLSRLIQKFETGALVRRAASTEDRRVQHLALTAKGRSAATDLDQRSASEVLAQLQRLGPDAQARLVSVMRTIEELLGSPPRTTPVASVSLRRHRPGDMGWVVSRHGAIYAAEYGWDSSFEALVAEIAAKFIRRFDPARERCWIAEAGGERVGCAFLVQHSPRVAQLRLLLVEPSARGLGVGTRLVNECLAFASRIGYRKITLWTNDCP